jgi:hypothetical protein
VPVSLLHLQGRGAAMEAGKRREAGRGRNTPGRAGLAVARHYRRTSSPKYGVLEHEHILYIQYGVHTEVCTCREQPAASLGPGTWHLALGTWDPGCAGRGSRGTGRQADRRTGEHASGARVKLHCVLVVGGATQTRPRHALDTT